MEARWVMIEPEVSLAAGAPCRLEFWGVAVGKRKHDELVKDITAFQARHAASLRALGDGLASSTQEQRDDMLLAALMDHNNSVDRGNAAWKVWAYNHFLKPFEHDNRSYFLCADRLLALIKASPDSLYMYAVFVDKTPDRAVYDRLLQLQPDTARHYWEYSVAYTVMESAGYQMDWVFGD